MATGNRSILQLEYADSAPTKWTYAAHADLPMGEIKRTFHCAGRDGRMAANHEPVRAMFPSLFYSPQQVARKRSRVAIPESKTVRRMQAPTQPTAARTRMDVSRCSTRRPKPVANATTHCICKGARKASRCM